VKTAKLRWEATKLTLDALAFLTDENLNAVDWDCVIDYLTRAADRATTARERAAQAEKRGRK